MRYTNERRARYLRGLAPADLRRVTLVCVFGDPDDPEPYELILTPEKDREAVAQIVSALRDIEPFGDFFQAVPTEWLILTPVHGRNIVVSPCYLWGKPDADGKYTLLEGFRSSRLIPVLQEITRTYKHRVKRMTPQTE